MSKMHKIKLDPYDCTVRLYTDPELFGRVTDSEDVSGWSGCTVTDPSGLIYVGVFDDSISTLVHELTHACLRTLQRVGIDPCSNSGEALCYLLDTAVRNAQRKLKLKEI